MKRQIKKILIPTDYSPNAKRAAKFGLGMAKLLNADVILFHAYHFPMTTSEDMVYISEMRKGEVKKLEDEKNLLSVGFKDLNISIMVEYGSAVDLIESISEKEKIDLIIMGTKGETDSLDAVLGSVASNAINNVKCTTLVIPEETRDLVIEEIVLAADFHATGKQDFYWPLLHILDKTNASIDIVNVKSEISLQEVPSASEIETDHVFEDYKHSHHFLESDNVEEALFDFANVHEADLIAILTRHYSLWERLWHKSLAKKLVLHSTIPLLIIHEDV
ncbi:MAG: universal stress protein [Crocinitomicaceae bacterium]|nr:universal stress protein [Crocinitomicaceae bacterium]